MRTVRIVPCLDVDGGRVVKGVQFAGVRDAGDPVELACRYDEQGADELVFYDITASSDGRDTMIDVVRRTADDVFIPLTVGGGVRTVDDARALLRAGADKVSVNSAAVERPALIAEIADTFGAECCVLGVDTIRRTNGSGHEVTTHGGRRRTGYDTCTWVQIAERLGAGEVVLNSIDRDGTESGYDLELIEMICDAVQIPVVASGGVGTLEHLIEGARAGADAVLAASIFHYGRFTIGEAKGALDAAGIVVRPSGALNSPGEEARRSTVMVVSEQSVLNGVGESNEPITMLNDRVRVPVPQSEGERRSCSGILIPATAQVAKRLQWAEVAAVGPNVRTVRSGDKILFNPEECFEVDVRGDAYLILRERDIHAVVSDRLDSGTGLYL